MGKNYVRENVPLSRFGVLVVQLESITASAAQQPPESLLCFDLLSAIDEEPKSQQARMPHIELGVAHTIKSHGATVARTHKHDWLILVLLAGIEVVLYVIRPFYHYVGVNMMTYLKYPLKENNVFVWSLPTLQEAMDYACVAGGVDSEDIMPQGSCYKPDTIVAHASFAFNSYWQKNKKMVGLAILEGLL